MSVAKTIDISKLSEAQQSLLTGLCEQFCKKLEKKEEIKPEPKVWKPKEGERFWCASIYGVPLFKVWTGDSLCEGLWETGNVFKTEQETIFAIEKEKIEVKLERYAKEHNDPDKEEWDGENVHYRIGYDVDEDDLIATSVFSIRCMGDIYFTSKEIAEDAANEVGVKRIMKYLFDVDCEVDE